ncbi:MAG TPA: PPC domain-containing DNA-binding protein [Dehalococcoidales bacterium]|nr:PPC domain-containing DNA-binding protein [Dehalococcoidales bacterium]
MKATEGKAGRVFIIRLEDGDLLPECIEKFAQQKGVKNGFVLLVGGIGNGQIVVGPRDSGAMPPEPMLIPVDGAHEVVATGILAPGDDGRVTLHIHGSLGRSGQSKTGCLRPGVKTWLVGEAILYEITGAQAARAKDIKSGFSLLKVD